MKIKKIGLIIVSFLLVLITVGVIFYMQFDKRSEKIEITPEVTINEESNELPDDTASGSRLNDQEQIKESLVKKNDWESQDIEISITKNDGIYASGMAGPVGGGPGGGMWFAKNVNENWVIVWDGNGVTMCENLEQYPDFPTDLIPECYDTASDQMINR